MKYTLDEVTEKLERACRRIDELQEKNLRLAEKNNSLIKDSIKAQEILTSQSVANEERDDLKRRLQNVELFIELMKDERQRANEKYGERIKKLEAEKAVMLEALESINYLINNSTGVWHLNGAIEPWERMEVAQEISDAIAVAKESPVC